MGSKDSSPKTRVDWYRDWNGDFEERLHTFLKQLGLSSRLGLKFGLGSGLDYKDRESWNS